MLITVTKIHHMHPHHHHYFNMMNADQSPNFPKNKNLSATVDPPVDVDPSDNVDKGLGANFEDDSADDEDYVPDEYIPDDGVAENDPVSIANLALLPVLPTAQLIMSPLKDVGRTPMTLHSGEG